MESKKEKLLSVVCSDKFLELPNSTQALYFHICARADEKGYIYNPKSLTRGVGAKCSDMTALINGKFVISYKDSGYIQLTFMYLLGE